MCIRDSADIVGIELEAVNFAAEYRERVFAHFLRDYAAGRTCLLYTSPSPRDRTRSRMPSSA